MQKLNYDAQNLFNKFIGFNDVKSFQSLNNSPPYNILKDEDSSKYLIEVALAGYSKESIKVELKQNTLSIHGEKSREEDTSIYLYKGITSKSFTLSLPVGKSIEVDKAEFDNGMLRIYLSRTIEDIKLIPIM